MTRFLAMAAATLIVLAGLAPTVLANDGEPAQGNVIVSVSGDVTVPTGDDLDAVVIYDGIASISGTVRNVVAVNAQVDLTGATVESIVAIDSPVTVGAGSVVGGDIMTTGAEVTQVGDAQVNGEIRDIGLDLATAGLILVPALFLLYLGFVLATIVAALILAALAARQVRAAEGLITHEPVPVVLAGLIGVIFPIFVFVALFLTIVGAPLAIAMAIGVWPLLAFVGYLVAAIWIGDWILARSSPGTIRERPYLAAVIGVLVVQVMTIIPPLVWIASLFGYGAVLLAGWRVFRTGSPVSPSVATDVQAPMAG